MLLDGDFPDETPEPDVLGHDGIFSIFWLMPVIDSRGCRGGTGIIRDCGFFGSGFQP